jgi:hypothetical protein
MEGGGGESQVFRFRGAAGKVDGAGAEISVRD